MFPPRIYPSHFLSIALSHCSLGWVDSRTPLGALTLRDAIAIVKYFLRLNPGLDQSEARPLLFTLSYITVECRQLYLR